MSTTFYGPWMLQAWCQEGWFTEYFTITGSESSDGLYEPADDGSRLDVSVTGQEWTIQFQASYQRRALVNYEPTRVDGYYPFVGRFAVLASLPITKPSGLGFVITHQLDVQLTSLDPLLSPPWEPPPDFTVRGEGPYGTYVPPRRSRR